MSSKLAFALDIADEEEAARILDLIDPYIGAVKVGMEYFYANASFPNTKKPIILDLKVHDIPETVARAVGQLCKLGAKYLTIHVQQRDALVRAAHIAKEHNVTLLGVTILSSMAAEDLAVLEGRSMYTRQDIPDRVWDRARFAISCGLSGLVCSPIEVQALRSQFPHAFFLVPGIRPEGFDMGDQKRIGTPAQTVSDGASMIVVGRPIRDAKDPAAVAKLISEEIER